MPQVPVIDESSVQPAEPDFVGVPTPPRTAYPYQVGATVEQLGAEVGRITFEEQQKEHEIRAMEAETEYQTYLSEKVYDVNGGFSSIYGREAMRRAPEVKADINSKREEISTRLGSRYAQRLFNNNSLRTLRFAQDHVDAWAGQQRRIADDSSYKLGLIAAAKHAGELASSPVGYDHEAVDALMEQTQQHAYERAAQMGMDEDTAQDYAAKSLGVIADSLIGGLATPDNPNNDFAAEEFERWGQFMSPEKRRGLEGKIVATGVSKAAAKILHRATRVSADPNYLADDDGKIDVDSYEKMIQDAKNAKGEPLDDKQKATLRHEVERQLVDYTKEYDARVKNTEGQVLAAGSKGHAFIINRAESGEALEWLRINAPERNAALEKQSRDNGDYELRGTTRGDKRASQRAFLAFQDKVLKMRDEEPAKFAALAERDSLGLGMDPPDQHRAWVMIQKYQKPDVTKLPGGSERSQIIDKLDSIYPRDTGSKQHARRYLLNKATLMNFKTQDEFNKWIDSEFEQSGTWFKSYKVEQEIEQEGAALKAATPTVPARAQGPDQKSVNLGRARSVLANPQATQAQKDWANTILKNHGEKP